MIKILIISDTHHNHKILKNVLSMNTDCDYLIHLGDEPDDMSRHTEYLENKHFYYVYGLYHSRWSHENAVKQFQIDNIDFCISHTDACFKMLKSESNPKSKKTKSQNTESNRLLFYCFGHTHHRHFEQNNNIVYLNPGHLKNENDRDEIAGYVVIEFERMKKKATKRLKNSILCDEIKENTLSDKTPFVHVNFFDLYKNLLNTHKIIYESG
ncbi:MAG: metallophosphatase family protein [Candidatus Cloacimonetes bacterium]|nr:metallophosphatase family protein [Candidatus Cloacimonadota bacterium]